MEIQLFEQYNIIYKLFSVKPIFPPKGKETQIQRCVKEGIQRRSSLNMNYIGVQLSLKHL